MTHMDVAGTSVGSKVAAVSMEARALGAKHFLRKVVVARLQGIGNTNESLRNCFHTSRLFRLVCGRLRRPGQRQRGRSAAPRARPQCVADQPREGIGPGVGGAPADDRDGAAPLLGAGDDGAERVPRGSSRRRRGDRGHFCSKRY